jgi:hypothetical protein
MKQACFFSILFLTSFICFAQPTIKGVVKDSKGMPMVGATITVTDAKTAGKRYTMTNNSGEFSIAANAGDNISISFVGFNATSQEVTDSDIKNGMIIQLDITSGMKDEIVLAGGGGGSLSPNSYWIGAKLGYNFDGFADDDVDNYFVGAAKVVLNKSKDRFLKGQWGIVGNIAGFISKQNKDDANKDLQKLTMSVQGLGVGAYELWEQQVGAGKNTVREYLTAGYRLNTFKKVGKDSATVNLSQAKFTAGFEFEAVRFEKGGALSFSFELSHLRFSKAKYNSVFGEEKSSLTSFETGIILPINTNFGFFASGTFAKEVKPVYLFGVIVRADPK